MTDDFDGEELEEGPEIPDWDDDIEGMREDILGQVAVIRERIAADGEHDTEFDRMANAVALLMEEAAKGDAAAVQFGWAIFGVFGTWMQGHGDLVMKAVAWMGHTVQKRMDDLESN